MDYLQINLCQSTEALVVIDCSRCDYVSALKSIYHGIAINLINGRINQHRFNDSAYTRLRHVANVVVSLLVIVLYVFITETCLHC